MIEEKLPVLKVHMLGGFSMEYGDKPISFRRNTATKSMKLLQILLHCGEGGIARGKLLESLYGREELADVANNLRVTSHRLKKMLVDAGLPEYDYIQIKSGIYRWSSPMEVEVDVHVFSNLVDSSKTETSEDKKIQLLKSACEVYHGEFLPGLSGEDWVLLESVQYKKKYTQALSQICDSLMKQREYETVLDLCEKASELYPFDEWQSVQVDCLMALNRYKEAIQLYEDTAKLFFEELGISPSEKMMNQFNEMSAKMSHKPQAINEIKGGLKEDEEEEIIVAEETPVVIAEEEPAIVAEPVVETVVKEEEPKSAVLGESLKLSAGLRHAISLNDSFRFSRELFGGDTDLMNRVIEQISVMSSYKTAVAFLSSKVELNEEKEAVNDFLELLKKFFNQSA